MKHIGRLALFLCLAVNAFFIGMLLLTAYSPYINPEVHPVQSCLGLTFPIFLVINFCFLIFWLIVRYRFALVPLLGFLLCYPQLRTYMPVNPGTAGQPENSIKLLSYNIMSFGNMKKENGQNPILNYIKNSNADIVCMQEYAGSETAKIHLSNKEIRQALRIIRITTSSKWEKPEQAVNWPVTRSFRFYRHACSTTGATTTAAWFTRSR